MVAERLVTEPGAEHKRLCRKVVDDKSSVEYLVGVCECVTGRILAEYLVVACECQLREESALVA